MTKQKLSRARLLVGVSVFWLALSMLFDGINTLVLPVHLLNVTGLERSATTLGLLTFVGLMASLLVQPIAGQWSDRTQATWGRTGVIAAGLLGMLFALIGLGTSSSLISLFSAYLALQVTAAAAQAAQQGFIPDLVPVGLRGRAAGIKGLMDVGGSTIGFVVLGGLLVGGAIAPSLLAIGGALIITFALTVFLVHERHMIPSRPPTRPSLNDAFSLDLRLHGRFAWAVIARFLFLLGTYAVGRFLLYYMGDRLGMDPFQAVNQAGLLLAGLALTTALAGPPAGWAADRWGREPLMVGGAVLSMIGVAVLIVAANQLHILAGGILMGLGSGAFTSANWALSTELAPHKEAARFMGLVNMGTVGGAAAAGLLGPIVDWGNGIASGLGFTFLFFSTILAFLVSIVASKRAVGVRPELPQPAPELAEVRAKRTMP